MKKNKSIKFFSNVVCRVATVYCFYNRYHDSYYVGQSMDSGNRMFDHSSDLANNRHRNAAFQNDYNELISLNKDPFKEIRCEIHYQETLIFQVRDSREFVALKEKLLVLESNLIHHFQNNGKKVYNNLVAKRNTPVTSKLSISNNHASNARPCIIYGEYFPSVLSVSVGYNHTPDTVRRKLENPEEKEWNYALEKSQNKPKKIRFNDPITGLTHIYPSMREAHLTIKNLVNQDLENYSNKRIYASPKAISSRCDNPKSKNFQWITSDYSDSDNRRNTGLPRKVWHNDIVYFSLSQAGKAQAVSKDTINKWCRNDNNLEWKFYDE